MTRDWLDPLLVPPVRELPSNAAYLAHLALTAEDATLIRLASNESTEPPSPRVRDALAQAYLEANLSAPPVPPLRSALAVRHGVGSERVLLGAGSTELIDAVFRTVAGPGDEVVLPTPSWPVYRRRLQVLGASIVEIPLARGERAWRYDVDALLEAITSHTKLLVLCSPNNPTGNSLPLAAVRRCAEAAPLLLLDAAYADFDEEADLSPLVHESERVVLMRTFSKAYCLAGLRVGYCVGAGAVIDRLDRVLVPGSSVASASLQAALAALEDEGYHRRQVERVRAERERVADGLRELGVRAYDSRGNFVAVEVGDAGAFAAALRARRIVVRVHDDRLVRITVGRPQENDALLAAVRDTLPLSGRRA